MTKAPMRSLASMNAERAGETAYEFEFLEEGQPTGVFLQVIGGQTKRVKEWTMARLKQRRIAAAAREMNGSNRPEDKVEAPEDDVSFGQEAAAVRLVGWRGLEEEFTPELGLELCRTNADAVRQIMAASEKAANFTRR